MSLGVLLTMDKDRSLSAFLIVLDSRDLWAVRDNWTDRIA
jgi:hypothetical protein